MCKFIFFLIIIEFSSTIKKSKNNNDILMSCDESLYLKATKNCQVLSPSIKKKSEELTKGILTKREKAEKIFFFVRDKIKFKKYPNTKLGAIKTLKKKKANCCDQSHLLVALLRAAQIPSQYQRGKCTYSNHVGGHVWVIAYVENKWVVLDPSNIKNEYNKINSWISAENIKNYIELPF